MSALDLHALAAMPHGRAAAEIRKTVDPIWGLTNGPTRAYSVTIEFTEPPPSEFQTFAVDADSEENAITLAAVLFEKQCAIDSEIIDYRVKLVQP